MTRHEIFQTSCPDSCCCQSLWWTLVGKMMRTSATSGVTRASWGCGRLRAGWCPGSPLTCWAPPLSPPGCTGHSALSTPSRVSRNSQVSYLSYVSTSTTSFSHLLSKFEAFTFDLWPYYILTSNSLIKFLTTSTSQVYSYKSISPFKIGGRHIRGRTEVIPQM